MLQSQRDTRRPTVDVILRIGFYILRVEML